MRSLFLNYLFFITLISLALGMSSANAESLPHYDLEMTPPEYHAALAKTKLSRSSKEKLQKILNFGTRNLKWLELINENREDKLSFTTPETQPAYPITAPNVYNPDLILARYNDLLKQLPEPMKSILLGAPLTETAPFDDATYIKWGFLSNRIYEAAARWLLMEPYLNELAYRRYGDVRGWYYLGREPDLKSKLDRWSDLSSGDKARLGNWLKILCWNQRPNQESTCQRLFDQALSKKTLWTFYSDHRKAGETLWNSFFTLDIKRRDVTTSATLFKIPFLNPSSSSVRQFLISNIEDEWQFNSWQLRLDFRSSGDIPRITFAPGVTPHVNKLGGNIITMDSNQPLSEYSVQWIIRHEFGHVIGFKDCYLEFYDPSKKEIMAYQLDIENLMCSRRGHLKETHLSELRKKYSL